METKEQINNRISGSSKVKEHSIITFFNWIFIILAIGIGVLTYFKIDENGSLIYQVFHVKVSFVDINSKIDSFLDNLFKKKNEEESVKKVDYQDLYISIGNNKFQTVDKQVRALANGQITYSTYQEKVDYFVIVQYENDLIGLYTFVDEPIISVNEKFEKESVLFSYPNDDFACVFEKNNEKLTYAEVVK